MDSPIRQYQKQKDYQRHKLFRKIKRRRQAEAEQAAEAPMKEMRRRVLRRFKDGKDKKPITTGGAGYIPDNYGREPKKLFYNNVGPWNEYNFYDVLKNFAKREDPDPIEGLIEHYNWKINDVYTDKDYEPEHARSLTENAKMKINDLKIADELLAEYLQIPIEERKYNVRLKNSKYKKNAYSLPITKKEWESIIYNTDNLKVGKNKVTTVLRGTGMNRHAVGRGFDSKGEYRSYGDSYDLNPFRGESAIIDLPIINKINDLSFGLGRPVEIYDRIYLDDYYGVKEPTHATYLPEVEVTSNRSHYLDIYKDPEDKPEPKRKKRVIKKFKKYAE